MSDEQKKDDLYKDTVFLPKTDFPMRGELPLREPETLKKWQDMDLYEKLRARAAGKPKKILHDGPPYANGHIHIGHAVNKILKDTVNRCWQMMGYNAPFVPGWDCHGLPIEWKIEEKYRETGKNKDEVPVLEFRKECRDFAQQWIDTQSAEFERLGVCADWKTPYLTMTNEAEGRIVREIHKFAQNGLLYRGAKPVMWSVVEKTALAEAEVEYKEHKSITVWVKFPVVQASGGTLHTLEGTASIVIWTTTPWTLPSNRAIACNEDLTYIVFEVEEVDEDSRAQVGEHLIVAEGLLESFLASAKIKKIKKLSSWPGHMLVRNDLAVQNIQGGIFGGITCAHPLRGQGYDFDVPVLAGEFVTEDTGTGFVHIAPGHGEDDFYLGMTHGIKVTDNVTDDGKFRDHVPLFAGLEVYTQKGEMGGGNFAVLKALDEAGALLAKGSVRHEYPHSWRSKAPLIFRTTPQWFIAMDQTREGDSLTLRESALKAIGQTQWIPEKGQARIASMIENRPDWCISRQRSWGVPIALFVDKKTGAILKDDAILARIGDIFEAEGSDSWWARPASDFLGAGYNPGDYEQVFDIVDVWFESGATHAFVLGNTKRWPVFEGVEKADLYLEGSDQHRGWFHSSLLESCGTTGHAPYKAVLTHGFVLDEKGYKMSKSAGNVVSPHDIMKEHGADILRLWTLTSDYAEDLRIGKDTLKQTADLYRRIRNTLRYLLGALDGFTAAEKIDLNDPRVPELERLVLHWLATIDGEVRGYIENFEFQKLAARLHHFCNNELSAFYFDIRKDRLYCDRPDLFERRAYRTVMAHLFEALCAWLSPILCFTAEEAWQHRPAGLGDEPSIHLRAFPVIPASWRNEKLAERWELARLFRAMIFEKLEGMRKEKTIGSSLEAKISLCLHKDHESLLKGIDWGEICIVSQADVEFLEDSSLKGKTISWRAAMCAQDDKCARCWKVLPEVGSQKEDLCNRCADAVDWYLKNEKAA